MNERDGRVAAACELTRGELADQHACVLPPREAMSAGGFDPTGWENFAMPVNEALALNYASAESTAFAEADQIVISGPLDVTDSDSTQEG